MADNTIIVGNDISDNNGQPDWSTLKNNVNFIFNKASEGASYIDKWYGYNRQQARLANVPFGSYHFARPDTGNTPEQEAQFFIDLINGDPIKQGEFLALDFEVSYSGDVVAWCKAWLDKVSQAFNGIKPFVYLNQSLIKKYDWSSVVNAGYPLWVADYTYDPNHFDAFIGAWNFAALQQWTDKQSVPGLSTVLDGDVFFGNIDQLKKYGFQPSTPTNPTPSSPTPTPQPTPTPNPVPPVPVPTPTPNPVPTPTPQPAPSDPCINYKKNETIAKSILYNSDWWWTKISKLQKVFPK